MSIIRVLRLAMFIISLLSCYGHPSYFQRTSCISISRSTYIQCNSIFRVHHVFACLSHVMFSLCLFSQSIMCPFIFHPCLLSEPISIIREACLLSNYRFIHVTSLIIRIHNALEVLSPFLFTIYLLSPSYIGMVRPGFGHNSSCICVCVWPCSVQVYYQSPSCIVKCKSGYVQAMSIIRVHHVLSCLRQVMSRPCLLWESIMSFHV